MAIETVSPEVANYFHEHKKRFSQLRQLDDELFWESGQELRIFHDSCTECKFLPMPDQIKSVDKTPCPECGGKLGLYRLEADSWEAFVGAPEWGSLSRSSAYKDLRIYKSFFPFILTVGAVIVPLGDEAEQKRAARDLFVRIGKRKLEALCRPVRDATTIEEVMDLLHFAENSSKSDVEDQVKPDYKFKIELKGISKKLTDIREKFKENHMQSSVRDIETAVSRLGSLKLKVEHELVGEAIAPEELN